MSPHEDSVYKMISDDFKVYKRALLAQGFWALFIHRVGSASSRSKVGPIRLISKVLHIAAIKFSEIFYGIYIGQHATIGRRFRIDHFGGVIINSAARIGDDVRIRHNVTIGNKLTSKPLDVPTIGNRVEIGTGAVLLGAIIVGDDAVVGANAVVMQDVPSGHMAVGVPARVVPISLSREKPNFETH